MTWVVLVPKVDKAAGSVAARSLLPYRGSGNTLSFFTSMSDVVCWFFHAFTWDRALLPHIV